MAIEVGPIRVPVTLLARVGDGELHELGVIEIPVHVATTTPPPATPATRED